MNPYLSGSALVGEDFSEAEVRDWYADEKEACFKLRGHLDYQYDGMNIFHGFSRIPGKFHSVLSFGGGDGAELLPLVGRVFRAVIADPSEQFTSKVSAGRMVIGQDGSLPCASRAFDLVTCFNVLHHVAKVSQAIRELYRVTAPGGYALFTEPVVSMGDWSKPRNGLTPRERGIPLDLFRQFIQDSGFKIISERRCWFGPLMLIGRLLNVSLYRYRSMAALDYALSCLPFPVRYHATLPWHKVRPTGVFFIALKP